MDSLTTSLQPQKDAFTREVFSTKPKILFCDLFLEPNESKTFDFEDLIPVSAPHSYNGRGLKYSYRVIVASQRLNRPIGTLRIPFRVLSLNNGRSDPQVIHPHQMQPQQQINPSITNPFFTSESKSEDKSTCISSHLTEPSARRVATFYDIKNTKGRVGRLCLFKNSFRLGEEIMGLFDFSQSESQCMQYSVSLFCEEELKMNAKAKPKVLLKQSVQEFSFGYDEVRTQFQNAVKVFHDSTHFFFRVISPCLFRSMVLLVLKMTIVIYPGCFVSNLSYQLPH